MMIPKNKISVFVIDNSPTTLMGLRNSLSQTSDVEVIGEAKNGYDAYALVQNLKPMIIVFEPSTPGPDPSELIKWVCENHPNINILVFTSAKSDRLLAHSMDSGASGCISKDETTAAIINAIRQAAKGIKLFDNEQYERAKKWKEQVGGKISQLTTREIEILEMLAKGLGNQEISVSLDISTKTAAYHVSNLLSKLRVKSRQEAAIWGLRHLSDDLE
ncbi:MAG: response regulator transcription factor [Chloroflexi bacterium]|nr:response regulator transcription factor [Chloroflexota bacterium]